MWIKLTRRNPAFGNGKILINTDNVSCVATGQTINCKGETLVFFVGDKDDELIVSESVDKVEEILENGLREGENCDRRECKQKEQSWSTVSTAQSTAQSTNLIDRQAAIDAIHNSYDNILDFTSTGKTVADSIEDILSELPSAQPELIEKTAYIRGFEQGRTQGMIDSQGGRNE